MVEQPVEQRHDGGGIAQELAPVLRGAIRSNQGRGFFIAAHHDLQEILGRGVGQPPHPQVVNEEQGDGGELRDVLLARAGELRIGELLEEDVGFPVQDAMTLLDHGEADRLGQVALARAGRNSHILLSFSGPSSFTMRWHPLVGQPLTVKSIQRAPDGQRALRCLLPDGTWTFLPEWMTSREYCARLVLVDEPCVGVAALEALIELLRALPAGPAPVRIKAETMSEDQEARRDATTACDEEQLELEWTNAVRWADVPVAIRDRVREHLGDLLRQAAAAMHAADGAPDE